MTNLYLDGSFNTLMWLRVLQSLALPFLFIPINALAFHDIPPEKTNNASALINLARNFGGSIGIAFASTLVTRRAQFHQSRLVEQLQGLNPAYTDFTWSARERAARDPHRRTKRTVDHPRRGSGSPPGRKAGRSPAARQSWAIERPPSL
jgi:DHA2 family multidrug resistance protein